MLLCKYPEPNGILIDTHMIEEKTTYKAWSLSIRTIIFMVRIRFGLLLLFVRVRVSIFLVLPKNLGNEF